MPIAQDGISWLNHRTHNLVGVERASRLCQDGDQCWVEIRANTITNHIEQ
jgi:hypothetical protein